MSMYHQKAVYHRDPRTRSCSQIGRCLYHQSAQHETGHHDQGADEERTLAEDTRKDLHVVQSQLATALDFQDKSRLPSQTRPAFLGPRLGWVRAHPRPLELKNDYLPLDEGSVASNCLLKVTTSAKHRCTCNALTLHRLVRTSLLGDTAAVLTVLKVGIWRSK